MQITSDEPETGLCIWTLPAEIADLIERLPADARHRYMRGVGVQMTSFLNIQLGILTAADPKASMNEFIEGLLQLAQMVQNSDNVRRS